MKKVLRLLGILALATSLTSGRNPKSNDFDLSSLNSGEGEVAPVCIVPAAPENKLLKVRNALPARIVRSLPASVIGRGPSEATTEPLPMPLWLSELNQWRRMAGLRVVAENAHLSYGSEEHARYLVVQGPADAAGFRAYDRSIGPRAHLENSHTPSYTVAGAEAAMGGSLAADVIQGADVAWEGRGESGDIDNLILAPFHRLSLLAPWARVGGYGSFGEYPRRAAALALRGPLDAQPDGRPIEFPPANTNISINAMSGLEWPNPIAGLRDQTSEQALEACGFDAAGFRGSDATQQKRGRELLSAYGAVVLIPRNPLSRGHEYHVGMRTSQGSFEWDFGLKDGAEFETAQAKQTVTRQVAATR